MTRDEGAFRLPPIKGRVAAGAALSAITWFQVGGPADLLVRPQDLDDLTAVLRGRPRDLPLLVMGVGSNLLVRDGGVPGIVLRLGRDFAKVTVEGDRIRAGAAALDMNVALTAAQAGLAGLEFLRGIPGTVGGALAMNAGAYGAEVKDVLVEATLVDADGRVRVLDRDACGFSYRHAALPEGAVVVEALFQGRPGDRDAIEARMAAIVKAREETQPARSRTGGSTFKNPPGAKAWELIDRAGCRGLRRGGAVVSELHCNFLINEGGATAADLEGLGEEVRRRVLATCGITLEWEIARVGRPAGGEGNR